MTCDNLKKLTDKQQSLKIPKQNLRKKYYWKNIVYKTHICKICMCSW